MGKSGTKLHKVLERKAGLEKALRESAMASVFARLAAPAPMPEAPPPAK
jgi:hypothetical protein